MWSGTNLTSPVYFDPGTFRISKDQGQLTPFTTCCVAKHARGHTEVTLGLHLRILPITRWKPLWGSTLRTLLSIRSARTWETFSGVIPTTCKMSTTKITEGELDFHVESAGKPCKTWYKILGDLQSGIQPLILLHGGPGIRMLPTMQPFSNNEYRLNKCSLCV